MEIYDFIKWLKKGLIYYILAGIVILPVLIWMFNNIFILVMWYILIAMFIALNNVKRSKMPKMNRRLVTFTENGNATITDEDYCDAIEFLISLQEYEEL